MLAIATIAAASSSIACSSIGLAFLAPPVPAPAPAETPAPSAAGVLRYSATGLDFGEMDVGIPKTITLEITNASDAEIAIASIKGGCGCTKVSATPVDPLAPGASFRVEITLDPGKKAGVELVRPLHVVLADGRVDTTQIRGRVKSVVAVAPAALDASPGTDAPRSLAIDSIDGAEFRVLGAAPAGVLRLPARSEPAKRFDLGFDRAAWESAGRPSSVVVATDLEGAREITVPIRAADAVALFRLPSAGSDATDRAALEAAQDLLVRAIDSGVPEAGRSAQFRMRLHRESGMLFVHGTERDLAAVRAAVRALPESSGVRESQDRSVGQIGDSTAR